jgi:hypothetical protein
MKKYFLGIWNDLKQQKVNIFLVILIFLFLFWNFLPIYIFSPLKEWIKFNFNPNTPSSFPGFTQSVGVLIAGISFLIYVLDLRKKYKLEDQRFKLDTDPVVEPVQYSTYLLDRAGHIECLKDELYYQVKGGAGHYQLIINDPLHDIFDNEVLLVLENFGKGRARGLHLIITQTIPTKNVKSLKLNDLDLLAGKGMKILVDKNDWESVKFDKDFYIILYYYSDVTGENFKLIYKLFVKKSSGVKIKDWKGSDTDKKYIKDIYTIRSILLISQIPERKFKYSDATAYNELKNLPNIV